MWSSEPVAARVAPTGTVVLSIRLAVGEIEAVRHAAADYRMTVSDLVRSALLQTIYAKPTITVGSGSYTRSSVAVAQLENPGSADRFFSKPCTAGTHAAMA